ncbi:hypothetical protein M3Y94_00503200 [Aphelenchoides besseyi]|nr:hypothetical protein M3Y94_00503200 [Aphelenchoides besseyi]
MFRQRCCCLLQILVWIITLGHVNLTDRDRFSSRAHDRRSQNLAITSIESYSQRVSWHRRIGEFVDVHIRKMLILMTCLNFFYCSFLFVNRSPNARHIINFTFGKICEVYDSTKTDLYSVFETINQLANETGS